MVGVLEVATVKVRQFMEQIDQQQQAVDFESNRIKEGNPGFRKLSLIVNQAISEKTGLTEIEEAVESIHEPVSNEKIAPDHVEKVSRTKTSTVKKEKNKSNQTTTMTVQEQADLVAQYLRKNGKKKAGELVNAIETIPWGNNPWNKLHYYSQINSQIKKVGKGYYDYSDSEGFGRNLISGENEQKPE